MVRFSIAEAVVLDVAGRDAPRYLQARLSNNIQKLAVGRSFQAAALSPQAKLEALFTVLRVEQERFVLVCDGGDSTVVTQALKRFLVADRVIVQPLSLHLVHTDDPTLSSTFPSLERDRGFAGANDLLLEQLPESQTHTATEAKAFRYSAGLPIFPDELQGLFFPESGLSNVIAFGKGCYCGQEAIERLDATGELARRVVFGTVATTKDIATNVAVLSSEQERVGKVLGSVIDGNTTRVCLLLRVDCIGTAKIFCDGAEILL